MFFITCRQKITPSHCCLFIALLYFQRSYQQAAMPSVKNAYLHLRKLRAKRFFLLRVHYRAAHNHSLFCHAFCAPHSSSRQFLCVFSPFRSVPPLKKLKSTTTVHVRLACGRRLLRLSHFLRFSTYPLTFLLYP